MPVACRNRRGRSPPTPPVFTLPKLGEQRLPLRSGSMCDRIRRGGHCPPVFFAPPFFSFSFGERKEPPSRQKKPAPFRFRLTAKVPHPQSPSSFPKADRRAGSQFGFGGFRRAARYLDDGGHLTFHRYGSQGQRKIEGAETGTSGPRRFLFYAFFRFQGWKEISHATAL